MKFEKEKKMRNVKDYAAFWRYNPPSAGHCFWDSARHGSIVGIFL